MNLTDVKKIMREENARIERQRQRIEIGYNAEIAHNKGKGNRIKTFTRGRNAR